MWIFVDVQLAELFPRADSVSQPAGRIAVGQNVGHGGVQTVAAASTPIAATGPVQKVPREAAEARVAGQIAVGRSGCTRSGVQTVAAAPTPIAATIPVSNAATGPVQNAHVTLGAIGQDSHSGVQTVAAATEPNAATGPVRNAPQTGDDAVVPEVGLYIKTHLPGQQDKEYPVSHPTLPTQQAASH